MVFFDISNYSGTGLGDTALKPELFNVIYIAPGGDIRTEGNVDETFYAKLFQAAQDTSVFFRIICLKGRCDQDGNAFASVQVFKEIFRIVTPGTGIVIAGIKTGAAGNATFRVNIDTGNPAFVRFGGNAGAHAAANLDTLVTANTVFICVHQR